jgi:hypothetical protein
LNEVDLFHKINRFLQGLAINIRLWNGLISKLLLWTGLALKVLLWNGIMEGQSRRRENITETYVRRTGSIFHLIDQRN